MVAPRWQHQQLALDRSATREFYGLLMEQGTGKTRVVIDTAAEMYGGKEIQALLVIAPEGVQRAWVKEALPQFCTSRYLATWLKNKPTVRLREQYDALWADRFKGLRVLTVNYETLATKQALAECKRFLKHFRTLLVADESHKIKSPGKKRTEAALSLSTLAPYRRILSGTPVTKSPFDLFSQMVFLDTSILRTTSFVAFKAQYAQMEGADSGLLKHINMRLRAKYGEARASHFAPQLVKRDEITGLPIYRNLDKLHALIEPHTFRVLKKDCLDLPPKVYERRYVELTREQRRIYDELREDFFTEFEGRTMTVTMAMTRLTRLQQIVGGFFKPDADTDATVIGTRNPKLEAMLDILEENTENKVLVWARFRTELDMIATRLREEYSAAAVAVYWGDNVKTHDAEKRRFIDDPYCRFFVANAASAGTGLDGLQVASAEVFFSNDYSLTNRMQAEDRAHRGGSERHSKVTIFDIEAERTLDSKIIETLRSNKEIAELILGDNPRNWI